jgi:hypothetical protein
MIDYVNGFQCRNCTDIDYAKKHIDPARPKDGPYGIYADQNNYPNDPAKSAVNGSATTFGPAVQLGQVLAGQAPQATPNGASIATAGKSDPSRLDLTV